MTIEYRLLVIRAIVAIGSVGLALLVGALAVIASGHSPIAAYYWLFQGGFAPSSMAETLVRATPLLFISLGLAVAFTTQVWNIGADGQFYMGALLATIVGLYFNTTPAIIAFPIIVLAAGIGGAAWAFTPGILRVRYGINEIITTLMFNYIAVYFLSYMLHNPLKDPITHWPESPTLASDLWAPILIPGTRLSLGVAIAFLLAVPAVYFVLKVTVWGKKLEVIGSNPSATTYIGVSSSKSTMQAMLVSGFMAGLAGGFELLGIHHKMIMGMSLDYGFTAIAVTLLGYLNPLLIGVVSIFVGGVINGSTTMQRMEGIPEGMAGVFQGLLIVFVLISYFIEEKLSLRILQRMKS